MSRGKILAVWAVIIALTVILVLISAACGHKRGQVTQLSLTPLPTEQPAEGQDSDNGGVLPPVMALDGCIAVTRGVSEDETVTSQGWEAYRDGQTGTNGTSGLNVATEGTALTLRAYALGEYAYAVYGQIIGADPKPLKTLIDCDPCAFGGGQDDDIPLSYFVGIADYSLGSWRWFGPFGEVDVMITVNSEVLKSRFKSPGNRFYLCVLASNGSKAATALPEKGLIADFPFEADARAVSAQNDDPGGLTIREICTWVAENLYTEPAIVTGLSASADMSGISLSWDKNADPEVFMYQVFRDDLDDEEPAELLKGVLAPETAWSDVTGVTGKEYRYGVRARNDAGFGGKTFVNAARKLAAPSVSASDGKYEDLILVEWTGVEGAVAYKLYRAASELDTPELIAEFAAEVRAHADTEPPLGQVVWYWVQAVGEDIEGPLSSPDSGFRIELDPVQVTATDGDYPDRVELVWGELDELLLTQYNVYRDTDEIEEDAEYLGSVYPPEHTYADDTAPWNESRFYFVKPVVGDEQPRGEGDWGHRGLATPESVSASQGENALKVSVSWSPVNHATRYWVYRGSDAGGGDAAMIAEVDAPNTNYNDTTAEWGDTEGLHYWYFVAALHSGPDEERSEFGGPAEGWRGIGIPQNVSATDGTLADRVVVSWSAVSQATSYQVWRDGSELAVVEVPTTTYDDYSAVFGVHYDYAVSAQIAGDDGPMSASDEGWRGIGIPQNVSATDGTYEDKITVTWDAVGQASAYHIYRDGAPIDIVDVPTTTYDDESVTPGVVYSYEVAARVPDGEGPKSEADAGRANAKPVADLTADPISGGIPLTVDFDASGSSDSDGTIVKYEWDWDGDGTYDDDSATDPTEAHTYDDFGEYNATVRVTDDDGGMDTETEMITCWFVTVDEEGDCGQHTSLAIVNGSPAISYEDGGNYRLKYVRASDANGSSWGTPVVVDSATQVGRNTSLAVVNGNPAISYYDYGNYDLKYVRASDVDGTSWATPVTVDGEGKMGLYTSLFVVNGNPAISYFNDTNNYLKYVRASDPAGASWGTPVTVDSAAFTGTYTSLAVVNGYPAISYHNTNNLLYVRANDADGTSWGTPLNIDTPGNVGEWTSLAVVNGNPAISYYDETNDDLKYARATDADGSAWGTPLIVDSAGNVGSYTSLAVVDGHPAISYYSPTSRALKYVRATDADGSAWGTPLTIDSAGNVGSYTSLAVVDGHPAISYHDVTNGDLKYAYLPADL